MLENLSLRDKRHRENRGELNPEVVRTPEPIPQEARNPTQNSHRTDIERPVAPLQVIQSNWVERVADKIRVSIIVNAYNEESEINRLLDSLKREWFPGMEVIISDDGSTDRTAAIVKKYIDDNQGDRPKDWLVLDSHENLGFAGAKNSGATHARGDYLFFFDADAPLPVGLLKEDLKQMSDRNLDIATHYLKPQNKLQSLTTAIKNKMAVGYMNLFQGPSRIAGCGGILIKKDLFTKVGGFANQPTGIGEDTDLSERAHHISGIRSGMIEGVQMPINTRRLEKQGHMHTVAKWTWEGLLRFFLSQEKLGLFRVSYLPSRRGAPFSRKE